MAYSNPFVIRSGLEIDFTVQSADTGNDSFLGRSADGSLTAFSTIPRSRISGGGNLTEATSSVLTITGGTGAVLTSGLTIQVKQANGSQSGYLSTTDWNTFNNKLSPTLPSGQIFVGNGSNVATAVSLSGDITIDNVGVASIGTGVILNADINAAAAIALTKLAPTTASRAIVSDGGGFFIPSATTAVQIGYLSNISQDLQASLNSLGITIAGHTTSALVQSPATGQNGYAIIWDNANNQYTLGPVGSGGSVTGPGSSVDNAIVTWNGTGGTSLNSNAFGVTLDASGNMGILLSVTAKTLHLLDTDDSHDLVIVAGSDLTADHLLSLVTGDADRTITLNGNPTLSDWFDQSVKTTADPLFNSITVSNTGGLHILDSDSSHDLIFTTSSNLTADRTLTWVTGDVNRTLTINASGTIYVTGGTDVSLADGGTGSSLSDPGANSLLGWDDTDNAIAFWSIGTGLSYDHATHTLSATSTGTVSSVTITQPSAGVTVTNSGVPQTGAAAFTFALSNDLAAIEGLAANGIAARTATDTWTVRTITGTTNRVSVTNGDGVSGNPAIDISTSYVGQSSITTLGTITTGVWNGTDIAFANIAQIAGLSVLGVTGSSTADMAAITGTSNQVLRVNGAGSALAFGSIDLSQAATVGSSILPVANGGTGSSSFPGWLLASGGTLTGVNTLIGSSTNTITFRFASLSTTTTETFVLENNTAAANNSQQISPPLVMSGFGWGTTAGTSQSVKFMTYMLPVQGTTPTATMTWAASLSGGAYGDRMRLNSSGALTLTLDGTNSLFITPSVVSSINATNTLNINTNGQIRIGINNSGTQTHTRTAQTSGTSSFVTWTSPANTAQTGGTEEHQWLFDGSATLQFNGGTLATQRLFRIIPGTVAFVSSSNATSVSTFSVEGPTTGGTNATLVRSSGITVSSRSLTNVTTGVGLDVVAPSGATTNLAATFSGNTVFGGTTITAGSVLVDFQSTTLGVLMPRVTNIASVATPVAGMIAYDAATNKFNFRENTSWIQLGGSGIGGSTGSVDNAMLRADGTGGSTVQASSVIVDDTGNFTWSTAVSTSNLTFTANSSQSNVSLSFITKGTGFVDIQSSGLISLYNLTPSTSSRAGVVFNTSSAGVVTMKGFDGIAALVTGGSLSFQSGDAYTTGNNDSGNLFFNIGLPNGTGKYGNFGFGASSVSNWQGMQKGLYIANAAAEPTAAIADGIALYSVDDSASTILGLRCETAVATEIATPSTNSIKVKINGTVYKILLTV